MKKYAGEDFAREHGYTLHSYSPKVDSDVYNSSWVKDGIFLDIKENKGELVATLSKMFGLVECKIHNFSIPNKNFKSFEQQINSMVQAK